MTSRKLALAAALALTPMTAVPAFALDAITLPSFAPLVKEVGPSVVTVTTEGRSRTVDRRSSPQMEEFFRRFGPGMPRFEERRSRPQRGIGSGFIIEEDGIIVTNNHVIDGADEITVRLSDGREFEAELLGRDDKVDLAVLKIEASDLPALAWGESDEIEVGDWTVAIGNPFGLGGTVTTGIVSARGRDIGSGPYDDYIQVDAAINKGNSGGPLFDLEGNVIGVNTMIYSPSGGNIGLGFAIPAEQASVIVEDLIDDGAVERGWIGVRIQPVTDDIAESLGLPSAEGALVAEVTADSPAEAAGLRAGDVIRTFDGNDVEELRDLTRTVAASEIGASVTMEVWREGALTDVTIAPALLESASLTLPERRETATALGLELRTLTREEAEALGIDSGLLITGVDERGAAAETRLRPGDLVLEVNQRPLNSASELEEVVAAAREDGRETVLLQVMREGNRRFLTLPTDAS